MTSHTTPIRLLATIGAAAGLALGAAGCGGGADTAGDAPSSAETAAPARTAGFVGDPARGEAVFARSCASCHGTGGAGGGIGPRLVDAGLLEASVASIVATGRGVMPGGLVEGTDAADVAAYVAKIGGGVQGPG